MASWTRDSVRTWAERHLPRKFRACHVGVAAERELGHYSNGQGVLGALKRFGLIAIVEGWDVGHATERPGYRRGCQGRKRGHAWSLIPHREPDAVLAERLRDVCDSEGI